MSKEQLQKQYKVGIDKMFDFAGTDIQIHTRLRKEDIDLDPISGEPIDPSIDPWVKQVTIISAVVRWATPEILRRFPSGTVYEGDLIVMVYATDVEKDPANPSLGTIFKDAEYVVADDVQCKLKGTPRRSGFPTPYVYHVILERST